MSLFDLAKGLRAAGGVLSPDAYKANMAEEAEARTEDRQTALLKLRQTLEQEALKASPQYQAQEEALRKNKAYEQAVAASGGDMSKIASAALQFGKPEVALNVIDRQNARQSSLEEARERLELRREQGTRDHEARLQRLTDERERSAATQAYRDSELRIREQGQKLTAEIARGNQEIGRLRLDMAAQQRSTVKSLTEFQGKNVLFGSRAAVADSTLKNLEEDVSAAGLATKQAMGRVPVVGGVLEAGANLVASDDMQRVEQAQRDFVNATLRQESGATISPAEFENAKKQYFPQAGDSKAVIDQKRRNRAIAIAGFKRLAGPGGSDIDDIVSELGEKPKPKKGQTANTPPPPPGFTVNGA